MTTIAIIDDSPETVKLIGSQLQKEGYETVSALDGEAGIRLVQRTQPDAVVLDVLMPEVDGIEVCRRLKADSALRAIPVILVTSRDLDQDVIEGLDAGADDYLTKPFHPGILAARVRSAIRTKRAHDELSAVNDRLRDEVRQRRLAEQTIRGHATELRRANRALNGANDRIRRINRDLRRVSELHAALLGCRYVPDAARLVTQAVSDAFGGSVTRLWLAHDESACTWCVAKETCSRVPACMEMVAGAGRWPSFDAAHHGVPHGLDGLGLIATHRRPLVVELARLLETCPCQTIADFDAPGTDSQWSSPWFAGVPMLGGGKVWGMLGVVVASKPPPAELEMLELVARMTVGAIRQVEQIEHALEASRAKSEFLANMSHEIRTPMTSILGFAEILAESDLDTEEHDAALTIHRHGQHLLGIVNDILDLSKIEAGRTHVHVEPCDPLAPAADVVSLMRIRAEAKNIALHLIPEDPLPPTIPGDPLRIRQILMNLVGNAIKFTEVGEVRVTVRLVSQPDAPPAIAYEIADTGIGISPATIGDVFAPFNQGDNSIRRAFGGTGLGLTISRRLARLLGGDITVESREGEGSTFQFTITPTLLEGFDMVDNQTTKSGTPAVHGGPVPTPGSLADRHVLLVEDGPDNQRLISFVLRKAGAQVTAVENGQEAVDLLLGPTAPDADQPNAPAADDRSSEATPVDLVLMDMQMPVMDGYEATQLLRRAGFDRPIIALTAHALSYDREKCVSAGCDEYLTKPIDRRTLIETIAAFTHQQAERVPVLVTP